MGDELTLEERLKQGLIKPGEAFPIRQTIEMQFQDNELGDLKEQFKQIQLTESKGSSDKRKLIVTVEGIHTGMTKNKTFYPGNTLEESVPTWTSPHHKPVIKNHNLYEEPLGRIVASEYVESTLTDKYTVRLKLEITDEDAIEKILDGRYLTLSVGGSANKVTCNACGKNLVEEGYCGHRRGKSYEGKEAYWIIGNYTGDEISFVNQPADVHSQVIAAELVTGEGGKNVKDGKTKENTQADGAEDPAKVAESQGTEDNATDLIDGLLTENQEGEQSSEGDQADTTPVTESQDDNSDTDNSDSTDNPENPQESEEGADDELARVKEELREANERIQTLESDIATKDGEVTTLTAQLSEKSDELEDAKKHLESAESEKETLVNQNVTLARFARKAMAERVVDLRIMQGKNKMDEREALIEEWKGSSTKVLESTISELLESGKRHIEHINNPGLALGESNAPIVDEDGEEIKTQKESNKANEYKPKTLKDFESGMKKSIFREV